MSISWGQPLAGIASTAIGGLSGSSAIFDGSAVIASQAAMQGMNTVVGNGPAGVAPRSPNDRTPERT